MVYHPSLSLMKFRSLKAVLQHSMKQSTQTECRSGHWYTATKGLCRGMGPRGDVIHYIQMYTAHTRENRGKLTPACLCTHASAHPPTHPHEHPHPHTHTHTPDFSTQRTFDVVVVPSKHRKCGTGVVLTSVVAGTLEVELLRENMHNMHDS